MRFLAMALLLPTAFTTASAQAPPTYDVYAIRYATIPNFPVRGLIAGADTARRMDIAMTVWLLRGNGSVSAQRPADVLLHLCRVQREPVP